MKDVESTAAWLSQWRRFGKYRGRAFAAAAVLLLLFGLVLVLGRGEDEKVARKHLEAGNPGESLAEIERSEREGGKQHPLELLKAVALHRIDRHGDELAVL